MADWLADRDALAEQYADASNLDDRIALHERYSTADRDFRDWQFDQFALGDDARVLTVGCGPGDLWPDVLDRVPDGWAVTLTDFSAGMVEEARGTLGEDPRFAFGVADAAALPFAERAFDAVTANHMLYHVPDRDAALSEIARVLQPGGRLYATTNGEENMAVIYDVLAEILGERPARGTEFTLENGWEQLEAHFASVALRRHDDALEVTDPDALVAYTLSRDDVPESAAPDLRAAFRARFEGGSLRIPKDVGMFVAEKG